MFRDLKEYQQLRALYEEQVYSTDLDEIVEEIFLEENFTDEEMQYVHENIDVLIQDHLLIEEVEQAQLDEVVRSLGKVAGKLLSKGGGKTAGKALSKGTGGLASRMSSGFAKNLSKIPAANRLGASGAMTKASSAAGGALSKFKNVASKLKDKAGKAIKKGIDFAKKNKSAVGGGAALGAVVAGGLIKRGLDRRAAINKQELSQKDPDDPTSKSNTGAPEAKRTEEGPAPTQKVTQPVKSDGTSGKKAERMGEIERQNRQRLGDKRVNFLKQKQRDFKSMDRAEFRKKYPNSQSAKDAAARKRRPNIMDYSSYTPEGDTINERLGGKGVSKKAAAGSIYPGEKGDGQTEDQDRGAGNKAKKRAGETVEKKTPTFMAYLNKKKEDKKEDKKESFDAYDIVLEYLLSSQQAATIEEANYIMTEMDAKTIQDIVAQQLNEQN